MAQRNHEGGEHHQLHGGPLKRLQARAQAAIHREAAPRQLRRQPEQQGVRHHRGKG